MIIFYRCNYLLFINIIETKQFLFSNLIDYRLRGQQLNPQIYLKLLEKIFFISYYKYTA